MKSLPSLHPGRFLAITLGGVVLGYMAAAIFCQCQPTVYRSSVLVAKTDFMDGTVRLAPIHAALIQRDWEEDWQQPLKLPAGNLSEAVSFGPSPFGVEVEVLSDDPKKGIDLAVRAAGFFRGMQHEVAFAAMDPNSIPYANPDQRRERTEALQLRTLLNEDAQAAGFADAFMVRDRAKANEHRAEQLWESETFQARWRMFEERATRIGIDTVPGDPLTAPPAILARNLEDLEYWPSMIERWLDRGMGFGLVLGLIAAFLLARRGPERVAPEAGALPDPAVDW